MRAEDQGESSEISERAGIVAATINADADAGHDPTLFITVKQAALRPVLGSSRATVIDLLAGHLVELERALGVTASDQLGSLLCPHAGGPPS